MIQQENKDLEKFLNEAIKSPDLPFKMALSIFPDDRVILNRYGKCMWHLAKKTQKATKKKQLQLKAEKVLTNSTADNLYRSIFAHSVLANIHINLYKLEENDAKQYEHLCEARKQGKILFAENYTGLDGCELATTCQKLAKTPNYKKYGQMFVSYSEYLEKALDYLNTSLDGQDQNYYITYTFGSIYFDLSHYRHAAEWMKSSLLMSDLPIYKYTVKTIVLSIVKAQQRSDKQLHEVITLLSVIPRDSTLINLVQQACSLLTNDDASRNTLLGYISENVFMLKEVEAAKALLH